VFQIRVLKRIHEPKMEEMIGERRKLHDEVLYNFYSSQNMIRMISEEGRSGQGM
jgi:hypothetical protein